MKSLLIISLIFGSSLAFAEEGCIKCQLLTDAEMEGFIVEFDKKQSKQVDSLRIIKDHERVQHIHQESIDRKNLLELDKVGMVDPVL